MKRIIILSLIALLAVCVASAARRPGEKVGASFPETVYDFGTVKQSGSRVIHEFVMNVDGDTPVVIVSANASCGCTRPTYDRKPVAPGKSAKIKVQFLPQGQKGEIDKSVRVRLKNANGKSETVNLRITGVVVP